MIYMIVGVTDVILLFYFSMQGSQLNVLENEKKRSRKVGMGSGEGEREG